MVFDLTRSKLRHSVTTDPASEFLAEVKSKDYPATELLSMLRDLAARGPLRAVCAGDTAVGRTLETALNITINSSRLPDYKGIEIKSGRAHITGRHENRISLFACVPDWSLSALKSSKQILDRFGYYRDGTFRLYCTVSSQGPNSQLLQLELDNVREWLTEFAAKRPKEQVAVWPLDRLHERLREKHKETFWVKVKSQVIDGEEHFTLTSVRHTRQPSTASFDALLDEGAVTVDHLIKRKANGGTVEKGPLFKIEHARVPDLFVFPPRQYTLTE